MDEEPPLKGFSAAASIKISDGIAISRIPGGMVSGKSAVGITAILPNGQPVFLEMSMVNFLAADQIFKIKEEMAGN